MPTTLPFMQGDFAAQEYEPVVLSFSRKDVKRCIQALAHFMESFGDGMIASGIEVELARYEDLLYRFIGVPEENMQSLVEGRKQDLLG